MTTTTTDKTIELVSGYANKGKITRALYRVIGLDEVISWSVPVSRPCAFHRCNEQGMIELVDGLIPCGACHGTKMVMVDETPSHIWFIDVKGNARQAKVNGKVRTWKRDKTRVELPLKYGLYEYGTFDRSDIEAGRLIMPV